jgi:hypothetical protein
MIFLRSVAITGLLCALLPVNARPQALPGLSTLRVGYNTQKNTVKPKAS